MPNNRIFLFAPILRQEVLSLRPSSGNHILAYLTSGFESFLKRLNAFARNDWGTARPSLLPRMAVKSKPPAERAVLDSLNGCPCHNERKHHEYHFRQKNLHREKNRFECTSFI
ncbi:MAG: hypothetical protein JRE72_06225 [Deltaproteobacteria bacterium]|nr:hypothetical protein [Deltaproteobacteria bacterium]